MSLKEKVLELLGDDSYFVLLDKWNKIVDSGKLPELQKQAMTRHQLTLEEVANKIEAGELTQQGMEEALGDPEIQRIASLFGNGMVKNDLEPFFDQYNQLNSEEQCASQILIAEGIVEVFSTDQV